MLSINPRLSVVSNLTSLKPQEFKEIFYCGLRNWPQVIIEDFLRDAKKVYPDIINFDFTGKKLSPLHVASGGESLDAVRVVLKAGGKINEPDSGGFLALHHAAGKNKIAIIKELLSWNGGLIDTPAKNGMTPLHSAVVYGSVEAVEILVRHGAKITKEVIKATEDLEADDTIKKQHKDRIIKFLNSAKKPELKELGGTKPLAAGLIKPTGIRLKTNHQIVSSNLDLKFVSVQPSPNSKFAFVKASSNSELTPVPPITFLQTAHL